LLTGGEGAEVDGSKAWVDAELLCSAVRSELVRRGLALADFERVGVTVDGLDREVLRLYRERGPGPIAGIVGAIIDRVRLGTGFGLAVGKPCSRRLKASVDGWNGSAARASVRGWANLVVGLRDRRPPQGQQIRTTEERDIPEKRNLKRQDPTQAVSSPSMAGTRGSEAATGAEPSAMSQPISGRDGQAVSQEQVVVLAYEIWLSRGKPEGTDQEDWFEAEGQLRGGGSPRPVRSVARF